MRHERENKKNIERRTWEKTLHSESDSQGGHERFVRGRVENSAQHRLHLISPSNISIDLYIYRVIRRYAGCQELKIRT